jgi:hypothetical protein
LGRLDYVQGQVLTSGGLRVVYQRVHALHVFAITPADQNAFTGLAYLVRALFNLHLLPLPPSNTCLRRK